MKKSRLFIVLVIALAALLVPMAASASGAFYCDALLDKGGVGSYDDPWACKTEEQFDYVVNDLVCDQYGGGHLYKINDGYYDYFKIELWDEEECEITQQIRYQGYPPDTGPELAPMLLIGGAVLAGGAFLVAGLAMRRKRTA